MSFWEWCSHWSRLALRCILRAELAHDRSWGTRDGRRGSGGLFEIEGPDEDACVRLVSGSGDDQLVVNPGPREKVAEKLAD